MRRSILITAVLLMAAVLSRVALADDTVRHITLANHVFTPHELTIPTGKQVKIVIKNDNGQTAEFQSFSLHRQKTIEDGQEGAIVVGPLVAGTYPFFDNLDVNKATGKIFVK